MANQKHLSPFGSITGNLPLLRLPAQQMVRLSGQAQWDCLDQLRHLCIRRAWKADPTGQTVRKWLDLFVADAFMTWSQMRGDTPAERFFEIEMEHTRRENEWSTCFGFFIDSEVDHLFRAGRAGPVLRGLLPPEHHSHAPLAYASMLERKLSECREYVRRHELCFETVSIVEQITDATPWLHATPPGIAAYFELGQLVREATKVVTVPVSNEGPHTLH
jgi:hypothetical protein